MYVSMSHLLVDEGSTQELIETFRNRAGRVDSASGFVDLQVWHSDRDPSRMAMVGRRHDRDSFKAYMRSDDHRFSHERISPGLASAIKLERLDHMHTFEVVAE